MNKFQQHREHSIQKIQEAALNLFAEHGYEKTTIRMIAKEAGIAVGLLYNYYAGKEEVLKAIFRKYYQLIHDTFAPDGDNLELNDVASYIQQTVKTVKQNYKFWKLIQGIRLQSPISKEMEAEFKPKRDMIQQQIETKLANAGISFPGLEAKLLFAALDGIIHHYLLQENYPIDDVANLLLLRYP